MDFCIPSLDYCIEFNGDYWHGNPKKYNENDVINFGGNDNIYAKDLWKKDAEKLSVIRSQGFECDIIWESDYRSDPEKVISECVKKITQKFKDLVNSSSKEI